VIAKRLARVWPWISVLILGWVLSSQAAHPAAAQFETEDAQVRRMADTCADF
jgi:hypothetical protein